MIGILPQQVIAVQRIDRNDHGIAGAHLAAAERIGLQRRARHHCGGRVEAQRLVGDHADKGQLRHILAGAGAPLKHRLRLGAGAILHALIERAEIERPGEGQRRRLVPGDDEGQQVVAQFGGVHLAFCLGVDPVQQQIEQVRHPLWPADAAGLDRFIGHGLHLAHCLARHHPARARHPVGKAEDVKERDLARLGDIPVDGVMHCVGIETAIAGKCHIADHVESGAHHVLGHVHRARSGGGNPRGAALGGGGHDRGEVHHVAMRKDRCSGAPLPAPMRALGDKE